MKKTLLTIFASAAIFLLHAQTPAPKTDSLQEYTGKYKFPAGSIVPETNVVLENGALFANSEMGSSELKKMEGDTFELVAYGGTATFKRNPDGKIISVKVEVDDIILEGTKVEAPAYQFYERNRTFFN
jgi:Domain of unknown function (DUF3471)